MPARPARLLALPLLVSVGLLGLTAVPSQGSTQGSTPAGDRAGASASASAKVHKHKHHKPKKKHHKNKTKNKHLGIPKPTFRPGPGAGQVTVSWAKVKGATNYSVRWNSAPYGKFPGAATYVGPRWLPGSARSAVLDVNDKGGVQASLPYGNPVFISLEADNRRDRAPRHKSKFLPAWPAVSPTGGQRVRIGQYNIEAGSHAGQAASNIASQGLGLIALQETANGSAGGAVAAAAGMRYFGIADEGIAFNPSVVSCSNLRGVGPHAVAADCSTGGRSFTFVSAHYTGSNADTGAQANATNLGGGTTVLAGDLTSNREPFGSGNQAQPVLVGKGFWDAQSSLARVGVEHSTLNGHRAPQANPSGTGTRADYILTRGIQGSYEYHNMYNQPDASDHNLVWTDVAIP